MHNHATLLLPVTCDLRSVVRKVGRSSRSSNSSMPSKGNKHPADFPYSWMVLYAFFSFTVCFGHSLTGVMVRLASDGVGTARSPSAYVTFATWLILK